MLQLANNQLQSVTARVITIKMMHKISAPVKQAIWLALINIFYNMHEA